MRLWQGQPSAPIPGGITTAGVWSRNPERVAVQAHRCHKWSWATRNSSCTPVRITVVEPTCELHGVHKNAKAHAWVHGRCDGRRRRSAASECRSMIPYNLWCGCHRERCSQGRQRCAVFDARVRARYQSLSGRIGGGSDGSGHCNCVLQLSLMMHHSQCGKCRPHKGHVPACGWPNVLVEVAHGTTTPVPILWPGLLVLCGLCYVSWANAMV